MDKISIFIVLLFSLFVPDAIGRQCSINEYVKGKDCVPCPACEPGAQYTPHCGYNATGHAVGAPQCQLCIPGKFKDKQSTGQCKNCQLCEAGGKVQKSPCTLTSNTVCECPKGMYDDYGDCRQIPTEAPMTSPVTSPPVTTSTRTTTTKASTRSVTSPPVTTSIRTTTTEASTRSVEPKQNGTQKPSTTVFSKSDKSPGITEPKAQRKVNLDGSFPRPGWIVFFCLLGSLIIIAFVFISCHKRTRKQISGFFCRKYRVLWPDHDGDRETTPGFLTVDGHYEEQQEVNPTNYATPIPPWEEPVLPQSSSTSEQVYCNCERKDIDDEKMQCACTLATSAIRKMAHTSSSAESISEDELQYYRYGKRQGKQTPTRKISPSPSNSSGVFPSRPPDHQCHLLSPCVTPTPPRGVSPDHRCVTSPSSSSSSSCVTPRGRSPDNYCVTSSSCSTRETPTPPRGLSPDHRCVTPPSSSSTSSCVTPRGRSPDNYCVTSSSCSTCETPTPPRGLSPDHRCVTSSSSSTSPGVTPRGWSPETSSSSSTCVTPLRGRSPDPSSLPSIQIHSEFSKEQEISSQSNEPIPISIEAYDKKHDVTKAPRKVSGSSPPGKRNSPSPKKDPLRVCKHELYPQDHWPTDPNHCRETVGKERNVPPVPTSNKGAESVVMATVGNDIKVDEIGRLEIKTNVIVNNQHSCMYRPINRSEA